MRIFGRLTRRDDEPRHRFDPVEFEDGCFEELMSVWRPVEIGLLVVTLLAVGAAIYVAKAI